MHLSPTSKLGYLSFKPRYIFIVKNEYGINVKQLVGRNLTRI